MPAEGFCAKSEMGKTARKRRARNIVPVYKCSQKSKGIWLTTPTQRVCHQKIETLQERQKLLASVAASPVTDAYLAIIDGRVVGCKCQQHAPTRCLCNSNPGGRRF